MKLRRLIPVILISLLLNACSSTTAPATPPHWAYEGEEGPDHWGELEGYATCGDGTHQSPIDVSDPSEQDLTNISFHYQPSEVNILNNGHTVQVNYDSGSYIELDGRRYDVLQFHYHAPSEHTVNGESFPAEIHIVHKNAEENLAVVGILLQEGTQNDAFFSFIDHLPTEKTDAKDAGVMINAADFLPAIQTTYRYEGSLTTPPCTEGVHWLLMTTPVELSAAQLNTLESIFEANNRPVQSLGERTTIEDSTP